MERRRPEGEMVRLRDVTLSGTPVFRRLATVAAWRRVVGPTLAERSRVELRDGALEVAVPDDRWALVVERMAAGLLARVREEAGVVELAALRVRIDPTLRARGRPSSPGPGDTSAVPADPLRSRGPTPE